jgi:uncharacterized protein (DUF4415 family)
MKTQDPPRVQISARIAQDVRDGMKKSQKANGRTWEREVEEALRFYLAWPQLAKGSAEEA